MGESHYLILALIQGLTEFVPVSSSGHLVLVPVLTGWDDHGLVIDVAAHVGSLLAVLVYTRRDVWMLAVGGLDLVRMRASTERRLIWVLICATIPVVGAGFILSRLGIIDLMRAPERVIWVVGAATLGFGLVLWVADRIGLTMRRVDHLDSIDACFIGVAQCFALIPGASRAGVTMTMARLLGMERVEAARFSLLLSIPAILAAGMLKGMDLAAQGDVMVWWDVATVSGLAFVAALCSIHVMMRWFRSHTMTPFVLYRIVLGSGLLAFYYTAF